MVAFWNRYYESSSDADEVMDWTGDYSSCNPGSVSLEYIEKFERRINFYRAMAGVNADTLTNTGSKVVIRTSDTYKPPASTTKQAAAETAAVMFSWAKILTHNPPNIQPPYHCWSPAAWNAANYGNLAIGFHGPDAVDAYMRENDPTTLSVWNGNVGHRRWLLRQGSTDFATGNTPGNGTATLRPTNVLYVFPAAEHETPITPRFVPWPSAGYFPAELMTSLWSLSHPNADFSSATVTMSGPAGAVPVTVVARAPGDQGEPTIVWEVPSGVAATSVSSDQTYSVTVQGVLIDGQSQNHSYQVTVMDPDDLQEPLTLTGTSSPPVSGAKYYFEPVNAAESHDVTVAEVEPTAWTEGAETGTTGYIVDGTDGTYALASTQYRRTGTKSFRLRLRLPALGFPPSQSFTLNRKIVANTGGQFRYYLKRGFMTIGETIDVEFSHDGTNWEVVDSVTGKSTEDLSFSLRTVDLEPGLPTLVRFVQKYVSGDVFNGNDPRIGSFIDDISVVNSNWVVHEDTVPAAAGENFVRLDSTTLSESPLPGESRVISLGAHLGGRRYSSPNPREVTFQSPLGNFIEWVQAEFPIVPGDFEADSDGDGLSDGLEYALGLDPETKSILPSTLAATASTLRMELALPDMKSDVSYEMEVSSNMTDWTTTGVSVSWQDGTLIGEVPLGPDARFARWKIEQN